MRDNGKEDAHRMRDNEKEDARKRGGGGRINEGGVHSRYQFFRCGKIGGGGGGGGADKRWGALWRYSTVMIITFPYEEVLVQNAHCTFEPLISR